MIVCTHTAATSGRADGGATGAVAALGSLQEEIHSGHEEMTRVEQRWWCLLTPCKEIYLLVLEILRDAALALHGQQDEDDGEAPTQPPNGASLLLQMSIVLRFEVTTIKGSL